MNRTAGTLTVGMPDGTACGVVYVPQWHVCDRMQGSNYKYNWARKNRWFSSVYPDDAVVPGIPLFNVQ